MDSKGSKPILLISPLPPPFGGIATWTRIICKHGLPDQNPLTLVNTRIRGKRNIFDKVGFSSAEFMRNMHVFCSLFYQLFLNRPKLIHLSCALSPTGVMRDLVCVQIASLFKVPVVSQYHGNLPDFNGEGNFGLSAKALRQLMRLTKINIFTNLSSLQQAKKIATESSFTLLPNFIEDEVFTYKKSHKPQKRCQAIFAGGITRAKGCMEIFALAREFPEIDFHLYGKLHADMAEASKQLPANVYLRGIVERETLLNAMCESNFLLFPSHTEGFPLTVLEAMTVGLPVIATNVGAIPEMINHGEGGYVVARGDTAALADAIRLLHDNRDLQNQMGTFNQNKSYNQYRYSIVTQQLQNIYGRLLCAE